MINQVSINNGATYILAAYNTENLRHSLAEYPRRIYEARQAVNQARKAYKDAELERATIEAEMVLLIAGETDPRGKPMYSNAETRAAELTRRKATDPKYLDAAAKVAEAETELNEAQDHLQMLLDEYQAARIVARLLAAEISMIGELSDVEVGPSEFVNTKIKEAF